jgi:hypothetical protein
MNTTSGSEADDPLREARAYNYSIYFMLPVPYLLLGLIGFRVYLGYRGARKKALAEWLATEHTENTEGG